MTPLAFENFCLTRGSMHIRNISFALEERETFAILGRTGAGKTLLLESAAGFYAPEGGHVLLYGTPVQDIPLTERRIGFVYQDHALFPHMSVEANIAYGLRVRRVPRDEQKDRARGIASMLGIEHVLKNYPQTLSGGEKQRVALARALVLRPRLLLLDEPFAGIDPKAVHEIKQIIRRLADSGIGILLTDHNVRDTLEITTRAHIISEGEILVSGTKEELLNNEKAKEIYFGRDFGKES